MGGGGEMVCAHARAFFRPCGCVSYVVDRVSDDPGPFLGTKTCSAGDIHPG